MHTSPRGLVLGKIVAAATYPLSLATFYSGSGARKPRAFLGLCGFCFPPDWLLVKGKGNWQFAERPSVRC